MNKDELKEVLPRECILHANKLDELAADMRQVRIAVCGDEQIGIHGLVRDVEELKEWRKKLDLRVAGIAGLVTGVLWAAKFLFGLK